MHISDFVFPRDLQITPMPAKRILLVGSCLAESYKKFFAWKYPQIAFDFILFNKAMELPANPPGPASSYDLQYLQIPLRSVLTDRALRYYDVCAANFEEVRESAFQALDVLLETGTSYSRHYSLPTIVTTFIVPERDVSRTFGKPSDEYNLSNLIVELNQRIVDRCRAESNLYVADLDQIAASYGKSRFLDDWWHAYVHSSAMPASWAEGRDAPYYLNEDIPRVDTQYPIKEHDFYELAWRQLEAIFRCFRQIDQVKLVIFDLDNTLWRGQIAEHYDEGREWPKTGGWPEGLAEAIHHLRARGILVAICSRNDEALVAARWDRAVPQKRLSLSDFVVRKINFDSKADNVADILEQTSLTAKSVVFVDDNPVERHDVKLRFPQMRVIGDNQFHTRRILLWAPETQVAFVSKESSKRETMVRQQAAREQARRVTSREEFLASLESEISLFEVAGSEDPNYSRVFELLNKTNQFNTTGKRWPFAELAKFLRTGRIFAYSVRDRFVDYGLVGVVLLEGKSIEQYVMSCRVLGMEIETSTLHSIMSRLGSSGEVFRGRIVETEANLVCRDVFERAGFSADSSGAFQYRMADQPLIAGHIKLSWETTTSSESSAPAGLAEVAHNQMNAASHANISLLEVDEKRASSGPPVLKRSILRYVFGR